MKAMILAAGLGTRLKPLTDKTPKPLLPLNGQPLITYGLRLLKKHGFQEVVINLHHLGEQIESELGKGEKFGLNIHYSWEKKILGTGGGIKEASRLFVGQSALVLNGDILIDVDLTKLLQFHRERKGIATMVLRPRPTNSGDTPIGVDARQQVVAIGANQGTMMYTGVQVIEPKLITYLPDGPSCIVRQGYLPALSKKEKIFGFPYQGPWNDLGTLDQYEKANGKDLYGFHRH